MTFLCPPIAQQSLPKGITCQISLNAPMHFIAADW